MNVYSNGGDWCPLLSPPPSLPASPSSPPSPLSPPPPIKPPPILPGEAISALGGCDEFYNRLALVGQSGNGTFKYNCAGTASSSCTECTIDETTPFSSIEKFDTHGNASDPNVGCWVFAGAYPKSRCDRALFKTRVQSGGDPDYHYIMLWWDDNGEPNDACETLYCGGVDITCEECNGLCRAGTGTIPGNAGPYDHYVAYQSDFPSETTWQNSVVGESGMNVYSNGGDWCPLLSPPPSLPASPSSPPSPLSPPPPIKPPPILPGEAISALGGCDEFYDRLALVGQSGNGTFKYNCAGTASSSCTECTIDETTPFSSIEKFDTHGNASDPNVGCWVFAGAYPKSRCDRALFKTRSNPGGDPDYHYIMLWWDDNGEPNDACETLYCGGVDITCEECNGLCRAGTGTIPGNAGPYDHYVAYQSDFPSETTWQNSVVGESGATVYSNGGDWCPLLSPPPSLPASPSSPPSPLSPPPPIKPPPILPGEAISALGGCDEFYDRLSLVGQSGNGTFKYNCAGTASSSCTECTIDETATIVTDDLHGNASDPNVGCWVFAGAYPKSRCDQALFKTRSNPGGDPDYHYILLWWDDSGTPHPRCQDSYCGGGNCDECNGRCMAGGTIPGSVGPYDHYVAYASDFPSETTWQSSVLGESGATVYSNGGDWCPLLPSPPPLPISPPSNPPPSPQQPEILALRNCPEFYYRDALLQQGSNEGTLIYTCTGSETSCEECTLEGGHSKSASHGNASDTNLGCWPFAGVYPKSRCDKAMYKTRVLAGGDPDYHYILLWWDDSGTPHSECQTLYCGGGNCDECNGRCTGKSSSIPGSVGIYDNFVASEHDFPSFSSWSSLSGGNGNVQTLGGSWCASATPPSPPPPA